MSKNNDYSWSSVIVAKILELIVQKLLNSEDI